jgi:hypothetical protein
MRDSNPWLTDAANDSKGGAAAIEHPHRVENIAWQTRPAAPTQTENALADALQAIFAERIYDLPRIVARLASAVPPPDGEPRWTEALLRAELQRLGR